MNKIKLKIHGTEYGSGGVQNKAYFWFRTLRKYFENGKSTAILDYISMGVIMHTTVNFVDQSRRRGQQLYEYSISTILTYLSYFKLSYFPPS